MAALASRAKRVEIANFCLTDWLELAANEVMAMKRMVSKGMIKPFPMKA